MYILGKKKPGNETWFKLPPPHIKKELIFTKKLGFFKKTCNKTYIFHALNTAKKRHGVFCPNIVRVKSIFI